MAHDVGNQLVARFRPVAGRRAGAAVGLWGPAGVGKSHAARALVGALTCASASFPAASPWPVWAAGLPRARRIAPWAHRALARLEAGELIGTSDAVSALLAALAAAAPFVLFVDDLHEADERRLEVLDALARALPRVRGAGLLVTSRVRPSEPFVALRVDALDDDAAERLLRDALGAPPPPEAAVWIVRRSEGNPLVLQEHLRFVRQRGALWHDGGRWRWREMDPAAIPRTVEALIERQLRGLVPAVLRLLEAKAYLPRGAADDVWRAVAGLPPPDLDRALHEVAALGVLRDAGDGGADFAQPLVREVLRRRLAPDHRRALAHRALDVLAGQPMEAAAHVDEADLTPAEALELLRRAATAAEAAGSTLAAARMLARAAPYAGGAERGDMALRAARALRGHDLEEVIRLARVAVDAGAGAEATHLLAGELTVAGRSEEAADALAGLPSDERAGSAWARHLIAVHGGAGDPRIVVDAWETHPDLHDEPDPPLAYAVAFSLERLDRSAEAAALATSALARAEAPLDRCRLLLVVGLARDHGAGDGGAALDALDGAVDLARAHGFRAWLAAALHNRAIVLEGMGRDDAMVADVEEALGVYGEVGDAMRHASTSTKLARHLIETGAFERAEELLIAALETLQRAGPSPFLVTCECVLSTLYGEWRPPHGEALALDHAAAALRHARGLGIPAKVMQSLAALTAAEAHFGEAARALEAAAELLDAMEGSTDAVAWIDTLLPYAHALEAAGRRQEAVDALARAIDLAVEGPSEARRHVVGLELDRLRGDATAAEERRAWFEAHGLHGCAARARRYFPERAAQGAEPIGGPVGSGAAGAADGAAARIEVLGPVIARAASGAVVPLGGKRRALLACLLEARLLGRHGVDRVELLDALYPAADDERAAAALKQLVYQVRRSLGSRAIVLSGDGYGLGEVRSDAEEYLATGETGLWRGPSLPGVRSDRARDVLHRRLMRSVRDRLPTESGEASRLALILLEAEPYDADVLTLTLQALRAEGDLRSLDACYREGRRRFAEVGEYLPEQWRGFLSVGSGG